MVILPVTASGTEDVPGAVRGALGRTLEVLQAWTAGDRYAGSVLVVLTGGSLVDAAVHGLVRAAQAEDPGRILLVTRAAPDGPVPDRAALAALLDSGNPRSAGGTARPTRPAWSAPTTPRARTARGAPSWSPAAPADSAPWSPATWPPGTASPAWC
ncbi:hypothetical protein ACFQ3Z_05005 [Streptomyces nogalater]